MPSVLLSKSDAWFSGGDIPVLCRQALIWYMCRNYGDNWNDRFAVVCPTAGDNRLAEHLINVHAYDINPKHPSVVQRNYEDLDLYKIAMEVIVFENPPFSSRNAVRFFNRMASFSNVNVIAVQFPTKYLGYPYDVHTGKVMNRYFHCVYSTRMPSEQYEKHKGKGVAMECSFQIWVRRDTVRDDSCGRFVAVKNDKHADYWVEVRNPLSVRNKKTQTRKFIAIKKPAKGKYFPIKVVGSKKVDDVSIIKEAVTMMYNEHSHTEQGANIGNLINALRCVQNCKNKID